MTDENLPYSTGNSTPCSVDLNEKADSKRRATGIHITHFALQQKLTRHCKATALQLKM